MNPIPLFTSKISVVPEYQQQSGQKKFDINFINPYLHPISVVQNAQTTTNMFATNPLQRTFASVVSCKPPVLQKSNDASKRANIINTNNDGIFNSFLKKIVSRKGTMLPPKLPYFEPSHVQKEFEDFKTLPSYLHNQRTASKSNSHAMNNNSGKNRHEKLRHSIEHDIRVDCDIFNIKKVNHNNLNNNNNNNQHQRNSIKTSRDTNYLPKMNTDDSNPPFEIYSLEEFPAIVATVTSQAPPATTGTPSSSKVMDDSDESDFVKYQDDIAKITPTFMPRRQNICEKVTSIMKSPQKLLNIPMISPKRSCLKPATQRRRTVSECSDDFIVFDRSCCDSGTSKDESDVDMDDDDDSDVSDEEEDDGIHDTSSESDEYEDDCDGIHNMCEEELDDTNHESHQPDSGMEEKKVHFNLVPKVHVMIAWNHAYRQARRGDEWRQSAVDRQRFAKRIADSEKVLNPIMDKCHRSKIYQDRFQLKTEAQ